MKWRGLFRVMVLLLLVIGLGAAGFLTHDHWRPWLGDVKPALTPEPNGATRTPVTKVILSEPAQKNLGLRAKRLMPQSHWRTLMVPGMIVERPGRSDRGIIAPVSGVVEAIRFVPGDSVRPGDVLFTLRFFSDSIFQTQKELFQTVQNIRLAQAERDRLLESKNVVPGARVLDVEAQIKRYEVTAQGNRYELLARGLTGTQVDKIAEGQFVSEIEVAVPTGSKSSPEALTYEIQELSVHLGQQVSAGQTLCILADHNLLTVEGKAFRDETPLLERSLKEDWPVEIDFQEESELDWPPLTKTFHIHHLANTIDPVTRTFAFQILIENQSKPAHAGKHEHLLWRFRPGQPVRILLRHDRLDNVFVLPRDAVVRDGADAFLFVQNVNTFERKAVQVLLQDRQHVVIANDGAVVPGSYVVQSAAAALNRMINAGSGGVPKGYHVHADGSLHKNDDEEH